MKTKTSILPGREQLRQMDLLRRELHVVVADCGVNEESEWVEFAVSSRELKLSVRIGGDLLRGGNLNYFSVRSKHERGEPLTDQMLDRIRHANDIVDVMSSYVPYLKGDGKTLNRHCPFRKERTPSFYVDRQFQLFKCLGCGVSGDVIKFVMLWQELNFHDAVKLLAKRAGILVKPRSRIEVGRGN